jgi:hypothetical protein
MTIEYPNSKKPLKVAQFGLGPIGRKCIDLLTARLNYQIVGAIDIDPNLEGKTVAEVCQIPEAGNGRVFSSFAELCETERPDVVLHTAGSRAGTSFEQCRPMLEEGLAVVSSCEELLYPHHRAPALADEIDGLCQSSGGRIVGTGVNPGFVLDLLPVCLSQVCGIVRGVHGRRIVNASLRRGPLQKKIGSGLAPGAYLELWKAGKAGHAGFQESLLLIAKAFGWRMNNVTETLEPVVSNKEIKTDFFHVLPGQTRGLHQVVHAESDEGHVIHLDLTMALDEPDPHDHVRLDSDPPVSCRIEDGVAGDFATVAALVNAIPRLLSAPPGVRLMTELPLAGSQIHSVGTQNATSIITKATF